MIARGNCQAIIIPDEADARAYLEQLEYYRVRDVGMPPMRPDIPAVRSRRSVGGAASGELLVPHASACANHARGTCEEHAVVPTTGAVGELRARFMRRDENSAK